MQPDAAAATGLPRLNMAWVMLPNPADQQGRLPDSTSVRLRFSGVPELNPATFDFQVSRNGEPHVTVTVAPIDDPNESLQDFVAEVQEALRLAGLFTPPYGFETLAQGIDVQLVPLPDGREVIEFIGLEDTWSFSLSGALSPLGFVSGDPTSSTAPSFTVSLNGGPVTTVYLNGGVTNGLVSHNQNPRDLADDINLALDRAGVRDEVDETGLEADFIDSDGDDIADTLIFMALNPGTGAGEISSFTVTGSAGLVALGFSTADPAQDLNSVAVVTSEERQLPVFNTLQELDALLRDPNQDGDASDRLLRDGYSAFYLAGAEAEVVFPIEFTHLFSDLTDVRVNLLDAALSGGLLVDTQSLVDLAREVLVRFELGARFLSPGYTRGDLTLEPPIGYQNIELDEETGELLEVPWNGVLGADAVFDIIIDDGYRHTIAITAVETEGFTQLDQLRDLINIKIQAIPELVAGAATLANQRVRVDVIEADDDRDRHLAFVLVAANCHSSFIKIEANRYLSNGDRNGFYDYMGFGSGNMAMQSARDLRVLGGLPTLQGELFDESSFFFSLNGGNYVRVDLQASATAGNTAPGDLVVDIEQALDNEGLSGRIRVYATELGQIGFEVIDDTVKTLRFYATGAAVDDLGFEEEPILVQQGSTAEMFVDNALFQGHAFVANGDLVDSTEGTFINGLLGIVGFTGGDNSTLDLETHIQAELIENGLTRFTIGDLLAVSVMESYPEVTAFTTLGGNYARVEIDEIDLGAHAIDGLNQGTNPAVQFGADPVIRIGYDHIDDIFAPGQAETEFQDLGGLERLVRLRQSDVVNGLYGAADFLRTYQWHNPEGAARHRRN